MEEMKGKLDLDVQQKIIIVRDQKVILDCDVASLYEVETKRINEAVKNNKDRFPEGYCFELTREELNSLRSKISTLKNSTRGRHTKYCPKAFTEKGLYMIATILRSPKAVETTLAIIETFAKIREMASNLTQVATRPDISDEQALLKRSGEILSEVLDGHLQTSDTETTIEVNFAMLKIKHTIKRKKKKNT